MELLRWFDQLGQSDLPLAGGKGANLGHIIPVLVPGMGMRFLTEEKLQQWLGDGSLIQPVLRALPHNPTTEMDLALWRLSRELKAEGAEPSADHPGVAAFLAKYGHRGGPGDRCGHAPVAGRAGTGAERAAHLPDPGGRG